MIERWLRGTAERLRALFDRHRFEAELQEELDFHLEEATSRYVREGMNYEAARRAALNDLGGVEMTKEQVRQETGVRWIQDLSQDIRYGVRRLAKRPGFTLALLATIGVAIGSNAAAFSLVHSILLKPLPFSEPDRIVRVYNQYPGGNVTRAASSVRDFYDRQEGVDAFDHVAVYTEMAYSLGREGGAQHVFAMQVTPSFFTVFRGEPTLGSLFPDDLERGAARYAVIGDDLWRSAFAADPAVVGRTIVLDGSLFEVVGVLPEEFEFATWDAQIYTPLVFSPEARSSRARSGESFHMVARLRDDTSLRTANTQLAALNATRLEEYSAQDRATALRTGFSSVAHGYLADLTASIRRPLLLLWLGAFIVLVAAVANVTTLFLIRATGRRREISCRLALGAGRARVLRQLLTESLIVATIGGVLGIALAKWSLRFLASFEVYEIPRVDDVSISGTIVAAGMVAALLLGTVATLIPARGLLWGASSQLGGGPRAGMAERPSRLHHALVGLQVAFSFVLVMTTGLLVETLRHLHAVDVGFEPAGVAVGATNLPRSAYPDASARARFADGLVDELNAHPDVQAAAVASQLPFSDTANRSPVFGDGTSDPSASVTAYRTAVTSEYFETIGARIAEGRAFERSDDGTSRAVAIVDEQLARLLWPNSSPIGRQIWVGEQTGDVEDAYEVVGVVASIRQNSLTEDQLPGAAYLAFAQRPTSFFRIVTKTRGNTADVPGLVDEAMASLDPSLLYYWVDVLEDSVHSSLLFRRLPMRLLSVFAAVSLLLVVLGVYGVTTHVVRSRTQELGLRMALGGTQSGVARLLAREWGSVVLLGIGVGILGMSLVVGVVRSLLFATDGLDPVVATGTVALIVLAAGMSFVLPVRRALWIDPARALQTGE